jgi:hypothetical protein
MTDEEKIQIRLDLEGELAGKFKAVKRDIGLENNTDVLRHLIVTAFKQLPDEKEGPKQ